MVDFYVLKKIFLLSGVSRFKSMNISEEKSVIRRAALVLISINLGLFLLKWIPTLFYPSVSVQADAFNSLGDFGYSLLFWLGLEISIRPKDEPHPHGHERFEPFVSLAVAIAITITGILVVRNAVRSIYNPTYSFSISFVIVLLVSAALKFWLSYYLEDKGEDIDSTALRSSSRDARADVIASFSALSGVLGAFTGFVFLDALVGFIVSFWIFRAAYEIAKESFGFLTGASPPEVIVEDIEDVLTDEEKVISYHDLEAHYVGPEIHVSVSVHLSKNLRLEKVHEIEEELKEKLTKIEDVESVYLHLEPGQ